MRKRHSALLLLFVLFLSCSEDSPTNPDPSGTDLLEKLQALNDVQATEITAPTGFSRAFEILVTQPVDPQNPSGATFQQCVYLSHRSDSLPVVLQTSGYGTFSNYIKEPADLFGYNQVLVTHRYFHGAEPAVLDWQHLTAANAAADCHKVVTLLNQIYTGAWISAGVSKGGQAALFHRRFYPGDVDATIAYVASMPSSAADPRFDTFLTEVVGTAACRDSIVQFQRRCLLARDSLLPLLHTHTQQLGVTISIGEAVALEYAVLEYPFSFWQFGDGDCSVIPGVDATYAEMFDHLVDVFGEDFYCDGALDYFRPGYYQALTELGFYAYVTEPVEDLLVAAPEPDNSLFAPTGVDLTFRPSVMADLVSWLQTEGDNIIYIYGGQDPWTSTALESVGATNALKIVQPAANHGVKIADLDAMEDVYTALEEWLGVSIPR